MKCKNCGKDTYYCSCVDTDWEDEDGEYVRPEFPNEKAERLIRNGKSSNEDKGGFLGSGFDYCPGDPFW